MVGAPMVTNRMHRWAFALAMISTMVTMPAGAQTSEHQRIGVERLTDWELGFELGSGMTREAYDSIDYLFVESYASIDALVAKSWTASLYVPLSNQCAIGGDVQRTAMAGLGDIEVTAGWTGRLADTRVSASLHVSIPTGEWNPYAAAEGRLVPGSGRWSVGTAFSASRILDPVVLGAVFSYDVGLSRVERFATSWRPGDMTLSLSVTEVLNDLVGYTLKATQRASLPEVRDGAYDPDSFSYAASASIELWYSDGDVSTRFGLTKSVTSIESPARLYATLSYALRSEKKHE